MREIIVHAYQYDELSTEAKATAIENCSQINVSFDWWDQVYDDAKDVGIEIQKFDIGRGNFCKIVISGFSTDVANNIVKQHGVSCETYQIAETFLRKEKDLSNEIDKYRDREDQEGINSFDGACEDYHYLLEKFTKDLERAYLKLLGEEYAYLTSEDAIIESILSNAWEFTEKGELI